MTWRVVVVVGLGVGWIGVMLGLFVDAWLSRRRGARDATRGAMDDAAAAGSRHAGRLARSGDAGGSLVTDRQQ